MRHDARMLPSAHIAVAVAVGDEPIDAMRRAAAEIIDRMAGRSVDLAVVFTSPTLAADPWALSDLVHELIDPTHLVGCMTEAVIGDGRELEDEHALVLWCAHLPGASIEVTRFLMDPDGAPAFLGTWPDGDAAGEDRTLLLLSDPFTFPAAAFVAEHRRTGLPPIIGGQASGGGRPGDHVLFAGRDVHFDGAVGVTIDGVASVSVVAQAAEPVGPEMVVTAGGGNSIAELAGVRAIDKITSIVEELAEQGTPFRGIPMVGIVVDENVPDYGPGDFVLRGILGQDPSSGAVHVGDEIRIGQTVRLHQLTGTSADLDLTRALRSARAAGGDRRPLGALMFTCNGRGRRLFDAPDHDAAAVATELGAPTAGMFANGEIGPVHGATHLHGFTTTMIVLLSRSTE